MKKRKLAIFDIDYTIFRNSLLFRFLGMLIDKKIFSEQARDEFSLARARWFNQKTTYDEYVRKVVNIYKKHIKGKRQSEIRKICHKLIKQNKKNYYRYTDNLIKRLRRQNYILMAVSGSPQELVSAFNKEYLNFDYVFGTVYEVKKGNFTGRVISKPVLNKQAFVRSIVEANNLSLENSLGVGDSDSDIGFLELASKPITFNPNKKLAEFAREKDWQIIVERKDMIYKIN